MGSSHDEEHADEEDRVGEVYAQSAIMLFASSFGSSSHRHAVVAPCAEADAPNDADADDCTQISVQR